MEIPAADIQQWSLKAFAQFQTHWTFDDFWTRANTFDACLGFVAAALKRWPADAEVRARRQGRVPAPPEIVDPEFLLLGSLFLWLPLA